MFSHRMPKVPAAHDERSRARADRIAVMAGDTVGSAHRTRPTGMVATVIRNDQAIWRLMADNAGWLVIGLACLGLAASVLVH